jgi:hypothetical protein
MVKSVLKTLTTGTNSIYHDEYCMLILVTKKFISILEKPATSIFRWDEKIGFFKGTAVRIPNLT